jgi:hypothetical protein
MEKHELRQAITFVAHEHADVTSVLFIRISLFIRHSGFWFRHSSPLQMQEAPSP